MLKLAYKKKPKAIKFYCFNPGRVKETSKSAKWTSEIICFNSFCFSSCFLWSPVRLHALLIDLPSPFHLFWPDTSDWIIESFWGTKKNFRMVYATKNQHRKSVNCKKLRRIFNYQLHRCSHYDFLWCKWNSRVVKVLKIWSRKKISKENPFS